ncbi:MAG: AsmA family protein, partial [Pseudomonadales bacterium]|nr:AsmA family protein [Pseudomonadales bacterium]
MTRKLQLTIGIPVVLVLALLMVLLVAILFVDPNDYRDQIEEVTESALNVDMQIKGEISWSLFPWIGFDINGIEIYTLEQGSKNPFIKLAEASAELKLWSLLSGEYEVGSLVLSGFKLNMIRDKNGRGNWQSLLPEVEERAEGKDKKADSNNKGSSAVLEKVVLEKTAEPVSLPPQGSDFSIAVAQIKITDAQVIFEDQLNHQKIDLDLKYLLATDINPDNTFPIEMIFTLENQHPALSVKAEMTSMMGISRGGYAAYMKELMLEGSVSGEPFGNKTVPLQLRGDLAIDRKADSINLKSLSLMVANFPITLKLEGSNISANPTFKGSVRIAEFNPKELAQAIGMDLPALTDNKALTTISMKARLSGSNNQWEADELKLKVDGSTLTGKMGISDLEAGALFWDLELDHFKLDGYLPAAEDAENTAGSADKDQGSETVSTEEQKDQPLPLDILRALNLQGVLRITSFESSNIELSSIVLKTNAKDGLIKIDPLKAELYQGNILVKAQADARADRLKVHLEPALSNVQIEPLLKSLASIELLTGAAEVNAELSMEGNTTEQLINSISGPGKIEVLDGKLKATNLTEIVCKGVAAASKNTLPEYSWSPDSDFYKLGGPFTVRKGVVDAPDMAIDLYSLIVAGKGKINIPQSKLDYRLSLTVSGELGLEGCEVSEKWREFRWPVRCKGAFDDEPLSLCKLDTAEVSRQLGKKAEETVKKKLNKKFK